MNSFSNASDYMQIRLAGTLPTPTPRGVRNVLRLAPEDTTLLF